MRCLRLHTLALETNGEHGVRLSASDLLAAMKLAKELAPKAPRGPHPERMKEKPVREIIEEAVREFPELAAALAEMGV